MTCAEPILSPLREGRFGPYEIVRPVGHGGMGTVFEARNSKLGAIHLWSLDGYEDGSDQFWYLTPNLSAIVPSVEPAIAWSGSWFPPNSTVRTFILGQNGQEFPLGSGVTDANGVFSGSSFKINYAADWDKICAPGTAPEAT